MTGNYPRFGDGDVEIYLSDDGDTNKFVLHSYVLALHSTWFKASLSERWSTSGEANGTSTGGSLFTGAGGRTLESVTKPHWVYELHFDKDEQSLGTLVLKAPRKCSKLVQAHAEMFDTLYHVSSVSEHEKFKDAKGGILHLAEISRFYGCEHVVKLHIGNQLLYHRKDVLRLCAVESTDMLELATAVKSDWVFMEAATNLIGRSKRAFDIAQPKLEDLAIDGLLNRKRVDFVQSLRDCEYDMFRISYESVKSDYKYGAVNFFREWLSEELAKGQGSSLASGYANLYHTIAEHTFYRNPTNKARFASFAEAQFADSEDIVTHGEQAINSVLVQASRIIQPILKDNTRRQLGKKDVHRALTFVVIDEDDLPWVKK